MRLKHEILVLLLILAVITGTLVTVGFRVQKSNNEIMVEALRRGLEKLHDHVRGDVNSPSPPNEMFVARYKLVQMLTKNGQQTNRIFPSFVVPEHVFLPDSGVFLSANELLCVVQIDNGLYYGITTKREFKIVSISNLAEWPHRSLK